jgi:RNA polymerase sigma factor (sigma-70 family)
VNDEYHPLTERNFRRLHDHAWSTLTRAGQSQARDLSAEDIRDALQYAFMQLWRHHGVADDSNADSKVKVDEPVAWLCKALFRRLLDIRHSRRREVSESALAGNGVTGSVFDGLSGNPDSWLGRVETPDTQLESQERSEWVKLAILQLREAYRSTLVWFYFHGASYEEIIARWKAHPDKREYTADSIAKIKLRGMKMLRELLNAPRPSVNLQLHRSAR